MDSPTTISVCSGIGALDHALRIAIGEVEPLLYVEREAFCAANLAWQMEQGYLAPAPVWSDLHTITREEVYTAVAGRLGGRRLDILCGGIPCQPWSCAGRQRGAADERDLWPATLRAVQVYRPELVWIENVAGFLGKPMGAYRLVRELQEAGYRAKAGLFSSGGAGASHRRRRTFILGHMSSERDGDVADRWKEKGEALDPGRNGAHVGDSDSARRAPPGKPSKRYSEGTVGEGGRGMGALPRYAPPADIDLAKVAEALAQAASPAEEEAICADSIAVARALWSYWRTVAEMDPTRMPAIESEVQRVADGSPCRVDQLRAVGNSVDPLVAALAFCTLYAALERKKGNR